MTTKGQTTIAKDEMGWIIIAGGATSLNPTYWNGLSKKQKVNLMSVTHKEMHEGHLELDTLQRECYLDYRAEGDSHNSALEKARLI